MYQCIQNGQKLSRAKHKRGAIWNAAYFSTVKGDRAMTILQQTAFCTWVFEMLSHSAWRKKIKKKAQLRWSHFRLFQSSLFISPGASAYLLSPRWLIGLETEFFFDEIKCNSFFYLPFHHDTPRDSISSTSEIDWSTVHSEKNVKKRLYYYEWLSVLTALIR